MVHKPIVAISILLVLGSAQLKASGISQVYWSDSVNSELWTAKGDGSDVKRLVFLGSGASPRGIAIDASAGHLYWGASGEDRGIYRRRLPEGELRLALDTFPSFPYGVEIDSAAGKLYWADGFNLIRRANLDGSSVETVIAASESHGQPEFLEVDPGGNKLYWSISDSGNIYRANLDGSAPETFISGLDRVRDIEILNGKIYWTDADARLIQRQNLDGTLRETLYGPTGLVSPHGLALDRLSGLLYVTDSEGREVYRGNMNGSIPLQRMVIPGFPGLVNPWDVEVLEIPEPRGLAWLAVTLLQITPARKKKRGHSRMELIHAVYNRLG